MRAYAGPGHWNDADMLEVGNGLTPAEGRTHFSMWSMLAAPLIAGNDVRNMSAETHRILTNREVIAVDQDSLGIQGLRYTQADSLEIWFKPLAHGDWAMAVVNRAAEKRSFQFDWGEEQVIDYLSDRATHFGEVAYSIRDLWGGEDIGFTTEPISGEIASHDVWMLRLSPPDWFDEQPADADLGALQPYPNPASSYVNIPLQALNSGSGTIVLYGALGRTVIHPLKVDMKAGLNLYRMSLPGLSSGTYFLESRVSGKRLVRTISVVN